MRVAVISDIHANYHALEAVLAALDAEAPDEIWCLGDTVGYGPEPNRCCALVAERAALCLAGNHDLAVTGAISVEDFNGDAAAAVRWTQRADRRALARLPARPRPAGVSAPGVELFHGSPLDPVWDYVLSEQRRARSFELDLEPARCSSGTATSRSCSASTGSDRRRARARRRSRSTSPRRASCSTPARSASRAARTRARPGCCVDLDAGTASFRRTEYPVARDPGRRSAPRGLPEALAARLALGV